jgi:hypothetical protein
MANLAVKQGIEVSARWYDIIYGEPEEVSLEKAKENFYNDFGR